MFFESVKKHTNGRTIKRFTSESGFFWKNFCVFFKLHSSSTGPFRRPGTCRGVQCDSRRLSKLGLLGVLQDVRPRKTDFNTRGPQDTTRPPLGRQHKPSGWSTAQPGHSSVPGKQLSWGVGITLLSSEVPRRRGRSPCLEVDLQTTSSSHPDHGSQCQHIV